jgi:hypothetical protein
MTNPRAAVRRNVSAVIALAGLASVSFSQAIMKPAVAREASRLAAMPIGQAVPPKPISVSHSAFPPVDGSTSVETGPALALFAGCALLLARRRR